MIEVGRMCIKIAGRDSMGKCVIVDVIDKNYVLIDGQVRRKKCNITHLEPLDETLKIKKNESHETIAKLFAEKGLMLKKAGTKEKKPKAEKPAKSPAKKEEKAKKETKKK